MRLRAAAGVLLAVSPALGQTWASMGPGTMTFLSGSSGRLSAVVASRTTPGLYYVAGADGGVWRTQDGGLTWTPLTDHMPTSAIGALALDPIDERIIYAGTGEANFANHSRYGLGLYKSTDGGDTWVHLAESTFAGRCFSRIVINPHEPRTLYAAITRAGGFPEMAAAKGHPGATGPRGVFRSDDGGVTWTHLTTLPALDATDLAMDPADPRVLYAAIGRIFGDPANGIYKTVDGGATWMRLTSGLPTSTVGRISLAVAPSDPQRLYALITNPCDASGNGGTTRNGYRSTNGGATWTPINPGSIQASYGWYLSAVLVHPTNPDVVFMGGLTLHRSTSGGTTWGNVTPPHVDIHGLAFDADGNLLCADDGGFHFSPNLGSSWVSRNAGLATAQLYAGLSTHPTNPEILLAGMQDNGSNLRTAGSALWTNVLGGDGGWTQIDHTDGQRLFAESQGTGSLYRSSNGGQSFTFAGSGLSGRNCFLPPYTIDPSNPQRMLYATERIYVSTDGGGSWSPLSQDLTGGAGAIRALAIAPSDSRYVYAATNNGRVLASDDGGATFALRLTNNPGWPRVTRELAVDPTDSRTVYLAGATFGAPKVRRSRDAGVTWELLHGNLPDIPVNVIGIDATGPGVVLFAGADDGVYRSVNEGATWRRYGDGLPRAQVVDLRVEPGRARLVVGTMGRGAWAAPLVLCYADFNDDGAITVNDYVAFLNAFTAGHARANCDRSTNTPTLNVHDFICFSAAAVGGCP